MKIFIVFGTVCFLLVGSMHMFFGSLLPTFVNENILTPSEGGMLLFFQFTGFLFGIAVSPTLINKYNIIRYIIFFHFVLCIILFVITLQIYSFWLLILLGFCLGVACGSLESTTSTLSLKQKNGVKNLSILEIGFGVGALLFPILIQLSTNYYFNWTYIVYFLIIIILLNLLYGIKHFSSLKEIDNESNNNYVKSSSKQRVSIKLNIKVFLLFTVFAFFYAGLETTFANYLPFIMQEVHPHSELYLFSVSVFWLGIIIGRAIISSTIHMLDKKRLIVITNCISLIGMLMLYFVEQDSIILFMIFTIGLALAGIFPISLALFIQEIKHKNKDSAFLATSSFIGAACLGGAILSLIIGQVIDTRGATVTLRLFSVFCFVLIIVSYCILNLKSNGLELKDNA